MIENTEKSTAFLGQIGITINRLNLFNHFNPA